MSYEGCEICGKDITNDEQIYVCRDCWDKEHLKSPSMNPQPDELEMLVEDCDVCLGAKCKMGYLKVVKYLRLLAKRVKAWENYNVSVRMATIEDGTLRLQDRIRKLEKDAGQLND